ncbi:MAG TPA: DUF5702 domain-containing protein [Bacillales bacterium]|nr:DUF5702 domain-containing protein [Bacillales bacterium]
MSIYAIIVTVLLFLFNAVLIDYARILVAQERTEEAAQAAVRSTLAHFDAGAHKYGLFGMSSDADATKTFQNVFEKNLTVDAKGELFQFVDTEMDASQTKVTTSRPLSDPVVLKHQILEDMKYRAPIHFTSLIYQRFMGLSGAMQQASTFTDTMNAIQDDVAARTKALKKTAQLLKGAKETLEEIRSEVTGASRSAVFPQINNLNDITRFYDDYQEALPEGDYYETACIPSAHVHCDGKTDAEKAQEYVENSKRLLKKLRNKTGSASAKLFQALGQLQSAEKLNEQVKESIKNHRNSKNSYYSAANKKSKAKMKTPEKLNKVEEQVDNMVMEDSFFTKNEKYVKEALAKTGKNHGLWKVINNFRNMVNDQIENSSVPASRTYRKNTINHFKDARSAVSRAYNHMKTKYVDGQKALETFKKENRLNPDEQMKEVRRKMNDFIELAKDQGIYDQLQQFVEAYGGKNSEKSDHKNDSDAEQTADNAMSKMDQLFRALGNFLETERNKVYVDEYIMTYFASSKPTGKESDFLFRNREVEYILYGIHEPGANYAAALAELFLVRFAINFIESFTQPIMREAAAVPFPFNIAAILAAALGYAIEDTANEMRKLKKGGPATFINISKHKLVDSFYSDYLRLFLFINKGGNSRLGRIMAVIQLRTGTDLTKSFTFLSANVTASVKPWFIPGITKMLDLSNEENRSSNGNKFHLTKRISYSY